MTTCSCANTSEVDPANGDAEKSQSKATDSPSVRDLLISALIDKLNSAELRAEEAQVELNAADESFAFAVRAIEILDRRPDYAEIVELIAALSGLDMLGGGL